MPSDSVLFAFGLTIFAGLATGVGSAMAFFAKKTNTQFLSISLGFSAGVMIYVSFIEIFVKARTALEASLGSTTGYLWTTIAFFCGIFLIAGIDKLVPSFENPHEARVVEDMDDESLKKKNLLRMGMFSALAIAIHNIPEGIAVSVPLYYATGSKKKAFFYSFASGLSEPVGALVGYGLFYKYFNDITFGLLFAGVAGIMVFISIDELLPTAEKYGEHHLAIYGMIAGMIVMALSLLLFA